MELKPCPNPECNGIEKDLMPYGEWLKHSSKKKYYVECLLCEIRGPVAKDTLNSEKYWNNLPRGKS